MKQVEITTARNVDYSQLQKYLQSKDWQGANRETYLKMLDVAGTKRYEYKPGKEPNFKIFSPGHLPTVERGYNFDVSLDAALRKCGI